MNPAAEDTGALLEAAIRRLLDERSPEATICPSEAARAVSDGQWRDLMEASRDAAKRLVAADVVEITQGGEVIDPAAIKGPIRIRRRRP